MLDLKGNCLCRPYITLETLFVFVVNCLEFVFGYDVLFAEPCVQKVLDILHFLLEFDNRQVLKS